MFHILFILFELKAKVVAFFSSKQGQFFAVPPKESRLLFGLAERLFIFLMGRTARKGVGKTDRESKFYAGVTACAQKKTFHFPCASSRAFSDSQKISASFFFSSILLISRMDRCVSFGLDKASWSNSLTKLRLYSL